MAAVSVDPSGRKIFRTRAAKASDRIRGTGYADVRSRLDRKLTTLPAERRGAEFNAAEQARYREEKERRAGNGTEHNRYETITADGDFSAYLEDHYSAPPVPREALTDECDVLCIGAGFGGLLLWHKLRSAGFHDVRFCEKGGDVGGTWYWNRYPGIACDVESYSYLPLLEEMGYYPTMKFASGFEILEYCQRMAERFGFYDHALFHTTVTETAWDAATGRWTVRTDRGDAMRARVVVLANGPLTSPQLAVIDGMRTFRGDAFHTSRWNYNVELKGKRVGIIGTGATSVQAVPELAKVAKELYVFQRTPSSVDVRDQRATTEEEVARWGKEPGWAEARRARFAKISAGRAAMQANDDYLAGKAGKFQRRRAARPAKRLTAAETLQKINNTNFRIMEQIRARVDQIVHDPKTAAALKPYYSYGCKRPTFHDEFLPAFNLPHVHLVDTAPRGVSKINERGVVHDGKEYPVDVLIYATGFQFMATSTFNTVRGRDGVVLTEKWRGGVKTLYGMQSAGFPNLFIVFGPQSGGATFNFTDGLVAHCEYIAWMLRTMRERGATVVDVRQAEEDAWAAHCRALDAKTAHLRDCISYYNGHGVGRPGDVGYMGTRGMWWKQVIAGQKTLAPWIFDAPGRARL